MAKFVPQITPCFVVPGPTIYGAREGCTAQTKTQKTYLWKGLDHLQYPAHCLSLERSIQPRLLCVEVFFMVNVDAFLENRNYPT